MTITFSQLQRHRSAFPALANKTYFNYGGQGPMPQAALDAINQAQIYIQEIGPFSAEVNTWIEQECQATRAAIASELNVSPTTITLTEDVTMGCNIAMWGIDWRQGDHLLLSDCEHPGIVAIATEIKRRFGVEVTTCPVMATLNAGDPVAVIVKHLRANTRLVVLSHVLWNTGQVLPLKQIVTVCREHNAKTLVDAAQSVGLLPLNLTELGVDFYAFTGHKWWCGPGGVGGLYVAPEARESLSPTFIGWRSTILDAQGKPIHWHPDGKRYEVATSNYPLYAGLRAAITTHQQWGTASDRYQQICHLSKYLWQHLQTISAVKCLRTFPPASGLVSFQLPNHQPQASLQLVKYLEQQLVLTRFIINPQCVRACVHYFTLESEIDQLVAEIANFCQT